MMGNECKCGASTLEQHRRNIAERRMGAHVYSGFWWSPLRGPSDEEDE